MCVCIWNPLVYSTCLHEHQMEKWTRSALSVNSEKTAATLNYLLSTQLLLYPYTIHPSVRMATTHRKRASLDFFYCPTQVHCQVQPSLSPKASRHLPSHCYGGSLTLWGIACCLASSLLPALWVLLWLPIIHSPYPVVTYP